MEIKVGDFYEDCAYHPVICTDIDGDDIEGTSLVDGISGKSCSVSHCGIRILSYKEAFDLLDMWKTLGKEGVLEKMDKI